MPRRMFAVNAAPWPRPHCNTAWKQPAKAARSSCTSADRTMLYAVAMGTGFRVGELASLTPASFDLAAVPSTVTVQASYSKRRRRDTQPLPTDVAAALRGYLVGKPAGQPVWPGNWHDWAADMLRVDLEAASIPFEDEQGRVADFHALRHSFIPLLERSGASPQAVPGTGPAFRHPADQAGLHPCPASRLGRGRPESPTAVFYSPQGPDHDRNGRRAGTAP